MFGPVCGHDSINHIILCRTLRANTELCYYVAGIVFTDKTQWNVDFDALSVLKGLHGELCGVGEGSDHHHALQHPDITAGQSSAAPGEQPWVCLS